MSVITVLHVGTTIGDGVAVLECPECCRTTGAILVARDGLALAVCRCGGLWRHDTVTEELLYSSLRNSGSNSELAIVHDDEATWPPAMLAHEPQLARVAVHLATLHAAAPRARLVILADRSLV